MKFTALTATQKAHVLVDMSEVSFLGFFGYAHAYFPRQRLYPTAGGHMVLYKPQPNVLDVLDNIGSNPAWSV